MEIRNLFEDEQIIVCEKPAGVAVQTKRLGQADMESLLKNRRAGKGELPYIGVVHRLDQPVSGVMVFAKTSKAASRLSNQVREKIFKKKYLAVVDGKFETSNGILEDYLYKDERNNISKVVNKDKKNSKIAKLEYEVLTYNQVKDLSLVKINLYTGRHHQIRVQLAHAGHSIFGDQKYGTRGKGKQIALWAYELTIQHPITKQELTFKCLPESNGTWCILKELKI